MTPPSAAPLLHIEHAVAGYGPTVCLKDVTLTVGAGEIVALLGANGAGKSTTLMSVSGLVRLRQGRVLFDGLRIDQLSPEAITARGIGHVPEGRRVFSRLTVMENLELGAYIRNDRAAIAADLDRMFELFPVLRKRQRQLAGTLSGGEQQMLAIGRGLMGRPKLLLLDEPSLGLAPLIVKQIFQVLAELNKEGMTIFLVEQNAFHALKLAHRGYVMVSGIITMSGTGKELLARPEIRQAYLEGGRH